MRILLVFFLLPFTLLQANNAEAQERAGDWRVAKKVFIASNGQKFNYEYDYSNDGRIQAVRSFSATGVLTTTISNFQFGRNDKPGSYVVNYNREGILINVSLRYDNSGRITELVKTISPRDITTFTYRYASTTIIITERKTTGESTVKDGKITLYNEHGDYDETVSDAASQTITSTIKLNQTRHPELEPWPDTFMGGYEAPLFFGTQAYGNEPEVTAIKNSDGLITSLTLATRTSTRKYEYTYKKFGAVTEKPEQSGTKIIITTNINCQDGKQLVERILSTLDGVFAATVEIRTGKLTLDYSPDGTPYTEIIKTINDAGFDADRKKSTTPENNPCKQPVPEVQTTSLTIQTNINCEEGKRAIERILKSQDGVKSAAVDIKTGKLKLDYSSDGTPYTQIIILINDAGFDADRVKSKNAENNPCTKKQNVNKVDSTGKVPVIITQPPLPQKPVIIITNINCAEGEEKVLSLIKKLTGVSEASVNIKTGWLAVTYNKNDKPLYDAIIKVINDAGFDADKKKTTYPDKNPCISIITQNDNKKPIEVVPPILLNKEVKELNFSTIQGKLFYRYKKENENPVSNRFDFSNPDSKVMTNILMHGVKKDNPYPDFIAEQRFPKTNDNATKPLKRAKISLIYTILFTKSKKPGRYEDFIFKDYRPENIDMYGNRDNGFYSESKSWSRLGEVVYEGETDDNGNFSLTFLSGLELGYLGNFEGYLYHSQYNKPEKGGNWELLKGEPENLYMHGALRLHVDEQEFYSPDILLFPKQGSTLKIPDEVALVTSFDLTVTAKTDTTQSQALSTSAPLSAYPIKIGRLQKEMAKDDPSMPFEAEQQEKKGVKGTSLLGEIFQVYDADTTDGNGQLVFKNLCKPNEHIIQAPQIPYAGSFVYKTLDKDIAPVPDTSKLYADKENKVGGNGYEWYMSRQSNTYNSNLIVSKKNIELVLQPKLPELYVRAVVEVKGKNPGLPGVDVVVKTGVFFPSITYKTNSDGYVQVKDLFVNYAVEKDATGKFHRTVTGPPRSLTLSKPGYATEHFPETGTNVLQLGQRWPAVEIIMKGEAKLTGTVLDEKGRGVASEIKVGDGPYIKTQRVFKNDGFFFIGNCEAGKKVAVVITPSVDQYFSDTLYIDILAGQTTKVGPIILKEKLHRVIFKIVDANNNPVYNAHVNLNNNPIFGLPTDQSGLTKAYLLASPGNEFSVVVKAKGFVSYDDHVTIPISKEPVIMPLHLTKGIVVSGYVKDAKTKEPIYGARVYAITGYNDDGEIQTETYTDKNGHYELTGVAKKGSFINNESGFLIPGANTVSSEQISVYAVKSGDPSYLRQHQTAKTNLSDINFELEALNCKAEIWGLPVEITSAEKMQDKTRYKISGAFVKLPSNKTFKAAQADARLPFKDIDIKITEKKESGGLKNLSSSPDCYMDPLQDIIALEASTLKVIVFDKFNCEITGAKQGSGYDNLAITKVKGSSCGVLKGYVESKLESFNFSYNYTGSFILQPFNENVLKNYSVKNEMIEVLGVDNCISIKDKYRLVTAQDESNFYVHDFKAVFSGGSYVVKDTFSLSTDVELQIPLVKTKLLNVGSIKVLQNAIIWDDYKGNVDLALETWNIKGSGLTYEKNQGGFNVTDAKLQTNLPELPLSSLYIQPTKISLEEESIDPAKPITLAGVVDLTLNNAKPSLVYEVAAMHDQKPHWRLNLTNNSNEPVAFIKNIKGLAATDAIAINMFTNYSDGEKKLNINEQNHDFFGVMSLGISNIEMGKNFFTLIGNTDLKIPGANRNITGRFKYMIDKTGNTVCIPEKLNTDVELAGKVSFSGKQALSDYELREGYFSAKGTATIYQNSKSDKDAIPLAATIIKDNTGTRMELDPGQNLPVAGSSSQKMKINYGKAIVNISNTDTSWDNLKFNTTLEGYQVVKKGEDQLDFEVKGAIALDPNGKKLQLDNIDTPLGGLELSFDFAKKSFYGQLHFNYPLIIPPGLLTVNEGIAEVQLDGNGFIFTGSFPDVTINPLAFLGEVQVGLAVGFYSSGIPERMANNLKMMTLQKQIPASLSQGLKGVYMSVSKGFNEGVEIPIIDVKIGISAGLDLRTIVNFNNTSKPDVNISLYGKAEGHAYIAGTGGELSTDVSSVVGFENGKFALLFKPGVKVKAVLAGKTIKDIEGTIIIGIDGSSFTFKPSF